MVLWCMFLGIGTWILWWPASTLYEYWGKEQQVSETVDTQSVSESTSIAVVKEDTEMYDRLANFVASPTRLDTSHIAVAVWDLSSNTSALEWHNEELMVPASSLKMLTAISALKRLGPNHSYVEKVLVTGKQVGGTLHGDVILQADDNPLVESLDEYVNALRRAGISKIDGRLILNLMRTDTLRAHHTASYWDIPYNRTPILLKGAPRIVQEMRVALRGAGIEAPKAEIEQGLRVYPPIECCSARGQR